MKKKKNRTDHKLLNDRIPSTLPPKKVNLLLADIYIGNFSFLLSLFLGMPCL